MSANVAEGGLERRVCLWEQRVGRTHSHRDSNIFGGSILHILNSTFMKWEQKKSRYKGLSPYCCSFYVTVVTVKDSISLT